MPPGGVPALQVPALVVELASVTGWSEREIVNLPLGKFLDYLTAAREQRRHV